MRMINNLLADSLDAQTVMNRLTEQQKSDVRALHHNEGTQAAQPEREYFTGENRQQRRKRERDEAKKARKAVKA